MIVYLVAWCLMNVMWFGIGDYTFFWGCEGRPMEIPGVVSGILLGHPYLVSLNLVGVANI